MFISMENKFKLSIFYEDQLKRIPLVTVPNQHLSTFETEEVHKHLKRTVQSVFGLPPGAKFKFYDKMSGKELTAQRFSSDNFPKYWTLVVSGNLKGSISPEYSPPTPKVCKTTSVRSSGGRLSLS